MLTGANVILETIDGKLAFQQRDNKAGILNPGKIALFGGRIENNEKPLNAAIREIKEELSLSLKKKDLKLFRGYPKIKYDVFSYIYVVRNIDPKGLKINEGNKIVFISKEDDLTEYNLSDHARELIMEYFHPNETH